MILMFTDFGADGPYLGQMQAVLRLAAPGVDAINLCSDAAPGEPRLASYLLAALAPRFPAGSVFLCVVDPGVGGERLQQRIAALREATTEGAMATSIKPTAFARHTFSVGLVGHR